MKNNQKEFLNQLISSELGCQQLTPRILFVHNGAGKFVQMDLALLRERYNVREWYQKTRRVNLPALAQAILQNDLVIGWFASWHTFFPTLLARWFRRPSLLIVGGYDIANMPEIGYGSQRGGIKQWIAKMTLRSATQLICNSEFSRQETIKNTGVCSSKVTRIYHAVEDYCEKCSPKEALVVTAGNVNYTNLQRKGLEPFVRAAALLPDIPFVLIVQMAG